MPKRPVKAQAVAADLAPKIFDGTYPAESWLPSERELAEKYQADRSTIRRALAMLETQGLVTVHKNTGAQVQPKASSAVRRHAEDVTRQVGSWRGFHVSAMETGRRDMAQDIRRLSSRVVYQNPWMTLREDAIERADGSKGIYAVIEKPDFALIIPIERDGFYLVQEYRYAIGRRVWSFPQGTFPNRQDGDPTELARAELLEETGIRADSLTHLGFLYTSQGSSSQGFNAFAASGLHLGEPKREQEEREHGPRMVFPQGIPGSRRQGRDARRRIPGGLRAIDRLGEQAGLTLVAAVRTATRKAMAAAAVDADRGSGGGT